MMQNRFFYPQKMGRIILLGMEEVMGRDGMNSVLRVGGLERFIDSPPPAKNDKSFPFETITDFQNALELTYGPRGGRGIALRVGRATFKHGIKEYGSLLGLTEAAFRMLPLQTKLRAGAKAFADLFNKYTDQQVSLEEKDGSLLWHIERCPLCWQRQTDEPACHLAVGLLQESLYWVSGGKIFNVEEISCIARGNPTCTIVIDQTPIS